MTEVTRLNLGQAWGTPTARIPTAVLSRYIKKIFPAAVVTLGLALSFAWTAFLGWCVFYFI
jgi:hypothetical protein